MWTKRSGKTLAVQVHITNNNWRHNESPKVAPKQPRLRSIMFQRTDGSSQKSENGIN
uniref:Uncharacterized protein n=1 Tax=Arundo donax TaxID=35708 RepID=A0A0A8XZ62_ARUDO